ncbi:MAG: amidase family protein [Candidatus Diapherotrites archaeon]|nr:amidase family protein [Candidatus Diapherotrites archaeon]
MMPKKTGKALTELRERTLNYLEQIARKSELQAFNSVESLGKLLERINELEKKPKEKHGKLFGLCFSIKDVFAVQGLPFQCSSKSLDGYIAPYSAKVVEQILKEDGIILGKTNCDEFACGSSGENSAFQTSQNPKFKGKTCGGSSSGTACSVSAELCDIGLGSDTGGSIRLPATFCNIQSFKPTHDIISRHGLSDLAMSLDTVAWMEKTVQYSETLLNLFCEQKEKLKEKKEITQIGIIREQMENLDTKVEQKIKKTIQTLERKGLEVIEHSMPLQKIAVPAYYACMYAEFSSSMQKFDGFKYGKQFSGSDIIEAVKVNRSVLGKEVKRRILLGTYLTQKEESQKFYKKALTARARLQKEYTQLFQKTPILISSVAPVPPFGLGEKIADPIQMYSADLLTVQANLIGSPAGSISLGEGIGLQVMGNQFEDKTVLGCLQKWENWVNAP